MAGVQDAKSVKELSDAALTLFNQSVDVYHRLNLAAWERATGARPLDADEVAKDATTFFGTVARDMGNLSMVWQQVARIAAPPAGPAPGAGAKQAAARRAAAKKAPAKKKAAAKKAPAKKKAAARKA
jgi:hypothetical protein